MNRSSLKKAIKHKGLENYQAITDIEKTLEHLRGYVFKMPNKGSSVILLLSGGMDSIASWGLLMKKYKLVVYPLVLQDKDDLRQGEQRSVKTFARYYQQQCPQLYREPMFFPITMLSQPYRDSFDQYLFKNPQVMLQFVDSNGFMNVSVPGFTAILGLYALQYANLILFRDSVKVRTIFCSIVGSDGSGVAHQTFLASRSIMLLFSTTTENQDFQFTSLATETSINSSFGETSDLLIQWQKLFKTDAAPFELTWSCVLDQSHQCGVCRSCTLRKRAFKLADYPDRTDYQDRIPAYQLFLTGLKEKIKKVIRYDAQFD